MSLGILDDSRCSKFLLQIGLCGFLLLLYTYTYILAKRNRCYEEFLFQKWGNFTLQNQLRLIICIRKIIPIYNYESGYLIY